MWFVDKFDGFGNMLELCCVCELCLVIDMVDYLFDIYLMYEKVELFMLIGLYVKSVVLGC